MSSMKALVGGCHIPEKVIVPRLIFSAVFNIRFIAAEKRMTEVIQPVTIQAMRLCHEVA
ncbi:hypothetical protein DPMN_010260 [Dreissena polymorpha]|uniref:Uncharacterized protein n=1 Tax=Dreissena polymorpha TaxID=45954 RepID=A0A9D4S0W6_DREPO|nr:hypothetical protein DPMN_010260 [Dreissena polymorpha]